jgi:hypothetical protein
MFDWKKFISGFNITDGEKLGKIIFFSVLIVVGLLIYHLINKPTQNIIAQKGSTVTVSQKNSKEKNWGVGVNVQNDKTVGVSVMYMF